jgi:hypothetical protein
MPPPRGVVGGAGGICAQYADLSLLAGLFAAAAAAAARDAARLSRYLADPELIASAVLDPFGAARFEAVLSDAVTRLEALAARCAAVSLALRVAAVRYAAADRLAGTLRTTLGPWLAAPAAVGAATVTLLDSRDPSAAAQRLLTDDPELADVAVGPRVATSTRVLALLWPDGRARLTTAGADPAADAAGPPRSLADLITGLAHRGDGSPGEVDVRIISAGPGAPRHVVVDIPGTRDWTLHRHSRDVTSLATNLRALAGEPTAYEIGVVDALRRAGVRPADDVVLIGHSEGGMIAVNAASRAAVRGEFHIGHVITAGAPIGLLSAHLPASVALLALENDGDVVPHLDGRRNPDRPNLVTVTLAHNQHRVLANHDLRRSYLPGAEDVQASRNLSLRTYLIGLAGVFTGDRVSTQTFVISRGYP